MARGNLLLLLLAVLCALGVVTAQHKARKLFNALQQEKERMQQMEEEWGRLKLEQSTLALPTRIERLASQQLQMQMPQGGQIRFVREQGSRAQQ